MAFLKKALKWLSPGVEPSEEKKQQGFQNGEFPSAGHFDFMFKSTFEAITELQDKAVEKVTGKGLSDRNFTQVEKTLLQHLEKHSTVSTDGSTAKYVLREESIPDMPESGVFTALFVSSGTFIPSGGAKGVFIKMLGTSGIFIGLSGNNNLLCVGYWFNGSWESWEVHEAFSPALKSKLAGIAENANNYVLPDASTTQKGGVQLNDTDTSTSTTQASTANALKKVKDYFNGVIGSLSALTTTIKTSIVGAINELDTNVKSIISVELPKYYRNGSGGGTLSNATSLSAGGIVSNAGAFFVGVDTLFTVADKKGYNSGNGTTLMPMRADYYEGNRLISEATRHLYLGTDGNVRVTSRDTSTSGTISYRPIQASSFDVASSYTYKQDISEMTRSALAIVDTLKICEYRMINDVQNGVLDNWQIGLIAEYSPQVSTDEDMKIDTYKMQSLNWKATQELYQLIKGHDMTIGLQQTQIDDQQIQINILQQELQDIKAMLQS